MDLLVNGLAQLWEASDAKTLLNRFCSEQLSTSCVGDANFTGVSFAEFNWRYKPQNPRMFTQTISLQRMPLPQCLSFAHNSPW
jgi:hypothetical protein